LLLPVAKKAGNSLSDPRRKKYLVMSHTLACYIPWQGWQLLGVKDGGDADGAHCDAAEAADEERPEDVVGLILEKPWRSV
jgi:hypothetical protein